jgi:hypothetical protein
MYEGIGVDPRVHAELELIEEIGVDKIADQSALRVIRVRRIVCWT